MVGDGEGVRWSTCQESRNSHECAAKHIIVNFRQAVSVLLICVFVFPCGLVGAPAVRKVTLFIINQTSLTG